MKYKYIEYIASDHECSEYKLNIENSIYNNIDSTASF